jgi:hypothetical protein
MDSECAVRTPELVDWYVISFENDKMKVFLNMTNPVYVSSSDVQDLISIRVIEPLFF